MFKFTVMNFSKLIIYKSIEFYSYKSEHIPWHFSALFYHATLVCW